MVRNPKRKSTRASQPHEIVLRAIKEVKQEKRSIRATAAKYDIPFRSLARYCSQISDEELDTVESEKLIGYLPNRKVCEEETTDDEFDSFNTSGEEDVDWAEINPDNFEELERDPKIDDFVLVKLVNNENIRTEDSSDIVETDVENL
ncbi:hypothetical protein JTB14_021008 [Gonioctena quinquepunctata]|nr:hypothetical protein JTB14_021008 [Gonioctena quinquepunctata]